MHVGSMEISEGNCIMGYWGKNLLLIFIFNRILKQNKKSLMIKKSKHLTCIFQLFLLPLICFRSSFFCYKMTIFYNFWIRHITFFLFLIFSLILYELKFLPYFSTILQLIELLHFSLLFQIIHLTLIANKIFFKS